MELKGNLAATTFTNTDKLSGLQRYKSKRVKFEGVNVPSSTTYNLLNLGSEAGTITNIWMTMNEFNRTAHLKIYFDGEAIPSIDVDLSTLFMSNHYSGTTHYRWSTQNMHGEGGELSSQGGYITFPMPYGNGVKVDIVTQSDDIGMFYAMIDYIPNMTSEYRLKAISRSITENPQVFASGDSLDLWQTPASAEGWLVYLAYIASGSGSSYLERNFNLYVDSEGSPSHVSSGTEDFFFGSYYWQGQSNYSHPQTALSYYNSAGSPAKTAAAVDLMAINGSGIYFSSNLRLYVPTEANVVVGHSAGHLTLFYTTTTGGWTNTTTTTTSTTTSSTTTTTTAGATTYFLDTFTDSNSSTAISSNTHTPDTNAPGGTYTAAGEYGGGGGTWGITSNKAYQATNANGISNFCVIDGGHTDGTLTCDMTLSATTNRTVRGLVFRWTAWNNMIKLFLVKVAGVSRLELITSSATLALQDLTLTDGQTYAVKIVLSGNNIKVYVDNTLYIDNSDAGNSGFTGTKIGMGVYTDGAGNDDLQGTWDNLKFTS